MYASVVYSWRSVMSERNDRIKTTNVALEEVLFPETLDP